jgi:D-lactate dehydrogenase (cytochrome)
VCAFETLQGAVETVIATIQMGVPVARMELMDEVQMDAVNRYSKTSYPVAPTIFFEFHSDSAAHVVSQAESVQALAAEHGGRDFQWAIKTEDRERLWKARHDTLYASLALRPGARAQITDVCVPISRLAACVLETKDDNRSAPFPITLVGHAGDGNFHMLYILDPANPEELEVAKQLNERLVMRALRLGGTCTGEHGVGTGKMKYLDTELGPAVHVMRTIKRALDPDNRLNPGKLIDVEGAAVKEDAEG